MLSRQSIINEYDLDDKNCIRTPGKFEACPVYAPYFYTILMEGGGDISLEDEYGQPVEFYKVTPSESTEFPELDGVAWVALFEDTNGFIFIKTFETDEEGRKAIAELEA